MLDEDRETQENPAADTIPAASLRVTARMAAQRGTRSGAHRTSSARTAAPRLGDSSRSDSTDPEASGDFPTLASTTAVRRRATASPRATAAPRTTSSPRRTAAPRSTASPRTTTARTTAAPRITAAPEITERAVAVSSRQTTSVRRVRPEEAVLVERATQVLAVVDAMREQALIPLDDEPEAREPVTIVHPATTALALPTPPVPRRPKPWYIIAGMWAAAILLIGAVLASVGPLAGQITRHTFSPRAAAVAGNGTIPHPSGPWDTTAGALNYLGVGGGAGPGVKAPGTAGLPVANSTASKAVPAAAPPAPSSAVSPPPFLPWPPSNPYMAVPGHPGYAVTEPSPDNYWWAWGQCTWWAQHERPDENLTHMGNAQYWAASAAARGYRVDGTASPGATVVFQPGVQGAGGAGHVAHVVAVYPDGWFLVSEMNFYWNGGGWARVDYRYAHQGAGVAFIH